MSSGSNRVGDEERFGIIVLGAAFMMLLLVIALQSAKPVDVIIITNLVLLFIVLLRITYKMTKCISNC